MRCSIVRRTTLHKNSQSLFDTFGAYAYGKTGWPVTCQGVHNCIALTHQTLFSRDVSPISGSSAVKGGTSQFPRIIAKNRVRRRLPQIEKQKERHKYDRRGPNDLRRRRSDSTCTRNVRRSQVVSQRPPQRLMGWIPPRCVLPNKDALGPIIRVPHRGQGQVGAIYNRRGPNGLRRCCTDCEAEVVYKWLQSSLASVGLV